MNKLSSLKQEYKMLNEEKTQLEKDVNTQHNLLIKSKIQIRNLKKNIDAVQNGKGKKQSNQKLVVNEKDLEEQEI